MFALRASYNLFQWPHGKAVYYLIRLNCVHYGPVILRISWSPGELVVLHLTPGVCMQARAEAAAAEAETLRSDLDAARASSAAASKRAEAAEAAAHAARQAEAAALARAEAAEGQAAAAREGEVRFEGLVAMVFCCGRHARRILRVFTPPVQ